VKERRGRDPALLDAPQRVNRDRCVTRQVCLTDLLLAAGPRKLGREALAVLAGLAVELLTWQISILVFLSYTRQGCPRVWQHPAVAYSVHEIFFSLQGEGAHAGRAAVFCRFAGCNLWTGREEERDSAICQFCDTDFRGTGGIGGGRFTTATELSDTIAEQWPSGTSGAPWVICTGGEPLLQLDGALIDALHGRGFSVAIETNGTLLAPAGIDWICVSPKAGAPLLQRVGNEIKVVFPQDGLRLDELERLEFEHRFVQPMDGPDLPANTRAAVEWCLGHPAWRLSLQTHKILQIR
jgi:7-carboxy-7-deazaguanine synthase (Cx14CxxC type)